MAKKIKAPYDPLALNDSDRRMLAGLPENMREEATKSILAGKVARNAVVVANRTQFSAKLNENNTIVIRGLNNRFPLGIRADSLQIVLDNEKALRPLIAEALSKTNVVRIAASVESMTVEQLQAALAAKGVKP